MPRKRKPDADDLKFLRRSLVDRAGLTTTELGKRWGTSQAFASKLVNGTARSALRELALVDLLNERLGTAYGPEDLFPPFGRRPRSLRVVNARGLQWTLAYQESRHATALDSTTGSEPPKSGIRFRSPDYGFLVSTEMRPKDLSDEQVVEMIDAHFFQAGNAAPRGDVLTMAGQSQPPTPEPLGQ